MTDYEYETGYPRTVYRGAQLLDERLPGWEAHVDPKTLDMARCDRCVLGQLAGGYEGAYDDELQALGIGGSGAKYGFAVWGNGSWDRLTAWWRELLRERKAKAA